MARPLVIFCCDADERIGGGHAIRCIGLAEALQQDGWNIGFAVSSTTLTTVPALGRTRWQVMAGFDGGAKEAERLRELWPDGVDLVVLDHYGRGAEYEVALQPWARQRLVIDDFPARRHVCEFLVDQTFGRKPEDYAAVVPSDCQVLAGPAYAILRAAFARARSRMVPPETAVPLRKLVVSFGMVDAPNLTAAALGGLETAAFEGELDVILGPRAPHLAEVRKLIEKHRDAGLKRLHIDVDAKGMAALLAECDLALGAAGISSFERCCLGVPALLVALAENQRDNVRGLVQSGAALHLGWWEDLTPEAMGAAVQELATQPVALANMCRAALQQTDGRGAYRIALGLRPSRTDDGASVTLRPAAFDDAELLYRWQQAPETRRHASNPQIRAWPEHVRWLREKLGDPRSIFNVVLADGVPAGMLRLAPVPASSTQNESYEISIFVAPEFHGRGIATAALKAGRRLLPVAELQAVVLGSDIASKRLFEGVGFHRFRDRYRSLPLEAAGR